nr:CapA family protein [Helicobacter saguini]
MGGDALLHTAVYKDAEYPCDAKNEVEKINFIQYSINLLGGKDSMFLESNSQKPQDSKKNIESKKGENSQDSKKDSKTTESKKQDSIKTADSKDSKKTIESKTQDSKNPNFIESKLANSQDKNTKNTKQDSKSPQNLCYEFSQMFEPLKDSIKKYDLAFYNQESILGGAKLGLSSYPNFNSPQEFGENMINLGFNLVSLANNHTLDKGEKAVLESVQFWKEKEKKGVITAGSYDSQETRNTPKIHKKNGITFAFLAYTYGTNGIKIPSGKDYLINVYTREMLKKDIESLKNKVDLIIISMHWGVEYVFAPTKEQRDFAQILSELGAHIVIGNHPHVVQPVEFVGDTLVIYSLGNMISAQRGVEKKVGAFVSVNVAKKGGKIVLSDVRADLTYTYHNQNLQDFKVYPFSLLNENILPNYEKIYKDYIKILLDSKDSKVESKGDSKNSINLESKTQSAQKIKVGIF